ncbi:DUF3068 domain-containing protein [Nocardiopsis suaedae]|uniref:DUF3068 domain-containing protein n=1 Tax=Nocardiopsis suaedae TaxID=3018444 RepID=A0ABT4TQM6_9ACTN|nr:DUF3068 domain-containing protein [Nocardiopsis suaedae]MDA2806676.1 DUF3068 domain-containing protein [Nocardiopsis suaedae]
MRRRPTGAALARQGAVIAVALGVFLLTSALMLRFYVYDQLAVIGPRTDLTLRMTDPEADYLDTSTWSTREGREVVRTTEISGGAAAGNDGWATWEVSVDTASGSAMIGHMDRRVVVDRATGRAVNCCGEHVDGDRAVRQAGLVLYWPAGADTGDRPLYDADVRSAPAMRYQGDDEVAGVPVRRYTQTIPPTQVPGSARPVPARALGLDRSGTVEASRWLELERTYWVEPVSGRVVSAEESRRETLRTEDGRGERLFLDVDLETDPGLVAAFAEEADGLRFTLRAVRTWAPIGLGALGGLVLASAPLLALRAARKADEEEQDSAPLAEDQKQVPGDDLAHAGNGHDGLHP